MWRNKNFQLSTNHCFGHSEVDRDYFKFRTRRNDDAATNNVNAASLTALLILGLRRTTLAHTLETRASESYVVSIEINNVPGYSEKLVAHITKGAKDIDVYISKIPEGERVRNRNMVECNNNSSNSTTSRVR